MYFVGKLKISTLIMLYYGGSWERKRQFLISLKWNDGQYLVGGYWDYVKK